MTTRIDTFDQSIQKTKLWIKEIVSYMDWPDNRISERRAYSILRVVLHALRDRLTIEETAHLGAQLPLLVRGTFYEGWSPANKPLKERTKEEFLSHMQKLIDVDCEKATKAVMEVLEGHISKGEIDDIKQMLPQNIRRMWPKAA